jgi:hypothetical protein
VKEKKGGLLVLTIQMDVILTCWTVFSFLRDWSELIMSDVIERVEHMKSILEYHTKNAMRETDTRPSR